jgi:hypothetical protein
MPSLKVGIEPVQDLHGYDNPWAGGSGKNKLNVASVETTATSNWGVSVSGNVLTVEHKNTYSTGMPRTADMALKAGTYCISYTASTNVVVDVYANGSWLKSVNPGDTITLSADSTVYVAFPNMQTTTITYQNVQLESGSSATSWTPYENICPISGHTEANVVVSPTTDAEDGTTYTIQFKDGDNPLTVYGGTLDVVSGELVVNRAMVVLDGTTQWNMGTATRFRYFDSSIPALDVIPWSINVVSNLFGKQPNYPYCQINSVKTIRIAFDINDTNYDTVAKIQALLTSNPLQAVYELATPTTYQLTPTQVKSLLGTNNVWADTGDIEELEYFSKA